MTFADIKAALFDGALVRVIGIDYADTYHIGTSLDGKSIHAYLNDECYFFNDMFADIQRALARFGAHTFRCVTDDGDVTITVIIEIWEEV